jgi:hypothetical protein
MGKQVIEIRSTRVDPSGHVTIEGLPANRLVDVTVREADEPRVAWARFRGQRIGYDRPFEPALDPSDWDANR